MFESEKGVASAIVVLIIVIIGASIGASAYIAISPKPYFTIRELTVAPSKVAKGSPVTVEVEIANVGDAKGTHEVKLKLGGEVFATREVTLDPNESRTVSFDVTKQKKGTYNLNIEGLSETFEVVEPAKFELSNLTVNPSKVGSGEPVNNSVDVRNIGEVLDDHTIRLRVESMVN